MKASKIFLSAVVASVLASCSGDKVQTVPVQSQKLELNPIDMRWTFGAHESYKMYKRIGKKSTGGINGNAKWAKDWLDWFDASSPALMQELGLNWIHSRFYKGMGWENEKDDFPAVKAFVKNCHEHGVHTLAYVQFSTIYPELMKAEIPDIMDWAQLDEYGHPRLYTNTQYFRYMPCINCREWEDYLKKMCTIALAEGGFDGIMFDNMFTYDCHCERCQKMFHDYLLSLPDKKERFGEISLENVTIPKYVLETYFKDEVRDPVIQAYMEWRIDCFTSVFKRLHDHIKSVNPNAAVSGNMMPLRYKSRPFDEGFTDRLALGDLMDIIISQNEHYPAVKDGKITSRIRELKLTKQLGHVVVALCDSDAKMTPEQEAHYLLPLYEDLVFGGVPTDRTIISPKAVEGFIDTVRLEKRRPLLKAFNELVQQHRDDFEAPVYAPVRLFFPTKEQRFSFASNDAMIAAEEILTRRHIPWGYIVSTPEKPFEVPEGTEVIVVAGQNCLSEAQVSALADWAKKGGKLVVTGDSGRFDTYNSQYLVNPFLPLLAGLDNVVIRSSVDAVEPCELGWTMDIGRPADNGDALVKDILSTGFSLPFEIANCPQTVALDVRKKTDGTYVMHFVNYQPSAPVNGMKLRVNGGEWKTVGRVEEYALVRL